MDISTREITSKQVRGNNVDFSTIEIHQKKYTETTSIFRPVKSKKVLENNVDFSTSEITRKKVRGNNMNFLISKITSRKVRGNEVNFSINEITLKKYLEMTWKFVEIWSSTYRRNIGIESTWIRRVCPLGGLQINAEQLAQIVEFV